MIENNDEKTISEIKEGLNFLDMKFEVKTPDINHFRELVSRVEEKKKVESRKEFFVFIIVALTILGTISFAYYKYSVLFLIVQMLSVLFIPVGIFSWFKRQRKQVSE